MILTTEERQKFAAWCRNEASTSEMLIAQMGKLPGLALDALAKRKRIEGMALTVVAKILESTESQTL